MTILPMETLETSAFDIAVVGEGEITVLEIVRSMSDGRFPDNVPGTCVRRGDGTIVDNGPRSLIPDLGSIPMPDYSMDVVSPGPHIRDRAAKVRRSIHVLASRGCPYSCAFCSSETMWHGRLRFYPAERVCDWLEVIIRDYDLDGINFLDDELLTNKRFLNTLCREMISRGINKKIVWECQARVRSVTDASAGLIKSAGCRLVRFGIESGSNPIMGFLKNNTVNIDDAYNAIQICRRHDLRTFGSFIIGSPDETVDDLLKTIEFMEEGGLNSVACFAVVPYPGTKIYEICCERGYLEEDLAWRDFIVEKYERDNTPRFVTRSRCFTAEQLFYLARYVDQNVVTRVNRGLPKYRGSHLDNIERIMAGKYRVSAPSVAVRLAFRCDDTRSWFALQRKRLAYISNLSFSEIISGILRRFKLWRRA